jgi:beta-glucanase (GH16 family)
MMSLRSSRGIFSAAAVLLLWGYAPQATAQIPDVPGWQLSFHDEFDGTSLNTTNWEALNRQDSYNDEKQYYRPEQVTVADGNLQLTATNQPLANKAYRSGLITSKALYGRGRFEARIDLPTTQGMWPAFWLNANQVAWPLGGEIDIMENKGSQPTVVSSAYHWPANPGVSGSSQYDARNYSASEDGMPVNFHDSFHTYAVEWEETHIRFYVDGVLYHTVTDSRAPLFATPKNIILNLAVGGFFGGDPDDTTAFPQTMLVDYVRVWQPQTGVAGDYNGDGNVDAADYTVWRNSNGQSGLNLPADGSGNGTVGPEDYDVWKANFGGPEPPGSGTSSISAPEPTAAVSMSVGILILCARRFGYVVPRGQRSDCPMVVPARTPRTPTRVLRR